MTEEQRAVMLSMLRTDLGIMGTTAFDTRFGQLLDAADRYIRAEGATPDYADIGDQELAVMYAGYLWRRRDSQSAMPRMLRAQLNNRVLAEKARGGGEPEDAEPEDMETGGTEPEDTETGGAESGDG